MIRVRVVDALTEWRARRWLSTLSVRFWTDGLAVAAAVPGLAAAVDQHAAAVRDILRQGPGGATLTDRVLLAGYGRGLLDRYDASMTQLCEHAAGRWTRADWLTLRLLAVCALGRATSRPEAGRAATGRSAAAR
jgi:Family of unknown function (DUF6401)